MDVKNIEISLGERSYDIAVGTGLLGQIERYLPFDVKGKKVFIVTDENVESYAHSVLDSLQNLGAGFCDVLTLPFGEKTKSYERLIQVHEWMLEHNIHRNSVVLAVGGGVIGDLAGFSASTVLRGVPYVQIPTTLL